MLCTADLPLYDNLTHVPYCAVLTLTRSVALDAGFGRHGMPPPASNDTGTAFYFPN